MRYGFVIDQNRCIGCHACTVACKEEHKIAIGVNRTWVKYVEKGHYPDTRRHFAVLRCNHCDDAPCVEICPTVALFRRENGIVDFDHERCIGCKSCMQACPYDALYIDPERNTAAKCNFDASRVEMGYKPACEVVCPTQAILSGDLDDSSSEISRRIAMEKVNVRKPEKGTTPKLFYVGVDGDLLQPTRMEPQGSHFWAEKAPGENLYALNAANRDRPIPGVAREVYDVPHFIPWGKKIASYLWTKSISTGVLLVAAILLGAGFFRDAPLFQIVSPVVALAFLIATCLLLILDLKKPARFFYLFTKPNFGSWLVLGGFVLTIYGMLAAVWLGYAMTTARVPPWVAWATALFAIASACYSAFLFGQAKGRELWQSPLLFWQLLVQSIIAGAAVLALLGMLLGISVPAFYWLGNILVVSLLIDLAMIFAEVLPSYGSEELTRSTRLLIKGALHRQFWLFVVLLGMVAPVVLILSLADSPVTDAAASLLALFGLWMYENLWIKAGQSVPLS